MVTENNLYLFVLELELLIAFKSNYISSLRDLKQFYLTFLQISCPYGTNKKLSNYYFGENPVATIYYLEHNIIQAINPLDISKALSSISNVDV